MHKFKWFIDANNFFWIIYTFLLQDWYLSLFSVSLFMASIDFFFCYVSNFCFLFFFWKLCSQLLSLLLYFWKLCSVLSWKDNNHSHLITCIELNNSYHLNSFQLPYELYLRIQLCFRIWLLLEIFNRHLSFVG